MATRQTYSSHCGDADDWVVSVSSSSQTAVAKPTNWGLISFSVLKTKVKAPEGPGGAGLCALGGGSKGAVCPVQSTRPIPRARPGPSSMITSGPGVSAQGLEGHFVHNSPKLFNREKHRPGTRLPKTTQARAGRPSRAQACPSSAPIGPLRATLKPHRPVSLGQTEGQAAHQVPWGFVLFSSHKPGQSVASLWPGCET